MNDTIVEIDAPKFEDLTKEQYNKILDAYGEYQRTTIDEIKHYKDTIKDLNLKNNELLDKIFDLKDIINTIIERI